MEPDKRVPLTAFFAQSEREVRKRRYRSGPFLLPSWPCRATLCTETRSASAPPGNARLHSRARQRAPMRCGGQIRLGVPDATHSPNPRALGDPKMLRRPGWPICAGVFLACLAGWRNPAGQSEASILRAASAVPSPSAQSFRAVRNAGLVRSARCGFDAAKQHPLGPPATDCVARAVRRRVDQRGGRSRIA